MLVTGAGEAVRVDVLGPLRLGVDGRSVDVRGPKRRAVLALLALAEGRTVTVDQVVDALWPDDPPDPARHRAQPRVPAARRPRTGGAPSDHRRRRVPAAPRRRRPGPAARSACCATAPVRSPPPIPPPPPRCCGRPERVARTALADLADVAALRASAQAAHELWRDVTDRLAGALIAAGDAEEALGPAADAVADDPLREPAVLLLVRALAATGQAPRALRTARESGRGWPRRPASTPRRRWPPSRATWRAARRAGARGGADSGRSGRHRGAPGPARTGPGAGRDGAAARHRAAGERGRHRRGRQDAHRPRARPSPPRRGDPDARGDHRRRGYPGRAGRGVAPRLDHRRRPHRLPRGARRGAPAAGAGQLRAPPRRRPRPRGRAPPALPGGHAADHEPRAARAGRGDRRAPRPAARRRRRRRVPRPRPPRAPRPRVLRRRAPRGRRDRPPAGGPPAGRRAGRRAAVDFAPAALALRLDRALDLLGSRALHARHRTLRATVAWSYDLLSDQEQRLFRHLSAFADGVDLVAVEGVAVGARARR